jgi:hypothetical protein
MYSDMKTVRPGDLIFIHSGKKIYGVFEAVTEFLEDPSVPQELLSSNIHYNENPSRPGSGWKKFNVLPPVRDYRRLAIKHFEKNGVNLCFEEGFNATEVFEIKRKKEIWSVPERWKYTDAARTVRPIMLNEALNLYMLLKRENSDNTNRVSIQPMDISHYVPIRFVLNPNIVTDDKIIEGWILSEIGRNQVLNQAVGHLTCFGNNIPIGYLKFADIIGYHDLGRNTKKFKMIEIKKERSIFPDDVNQLLSYVDWVSENITHDKKLTLGIIIANDFDRECVNFVQNFNSIMIGVKIRLVKFQYSQDGYASLGLQQVV